MQGAFIVQFNISYQRVEVLWNICPFCMQFYKKGRVRAMDVLIQNMTLIIAIISALAFVVSVITEVFKGVGFLSKIPTDVVVLILSIGITVVVFIAYMQYIQQAILWYMILATIMAGFIVAFVAMYGWEKLSELWTRFNMKKE